MLLYELNGNYILVDHAKSLGRGGVTVIGDMGSFFYYGKEGDLVECELGKLPHIFDMSRKGICLYHAHDLRRFPESDRQKLYQANFFFFN